MRLVQRDLDGEHPPVGQHPVRDARGDGLDEVVRLARHDRRRALGQLAVVQRVDEVVRSGGGGEIHPHGDVDDEVLPVAALVVEDAVVAAHPQATQLDPVRLGSIGGWFTACSPRRCGRGRRRG